MKDFKDKHKGEPCFIVGTGPSLNSVDIDKLNTKITMGMSRVVIHPTLRIKYYCVESERTVKQAHYDIWKYRCDAKFIPFRYKGYDLGPETVWVNFLHFYFKGIPKFSFDCSESIYWGCNVLYMALQLAAYMGCNPLYLIGFDWFKSGIDMKIHFHDDNVIKEYDPPRLDLQNKFMKFAASELARHGCKVYNLCKTSHLEPFPKKDINEVL